MLDVDLQQVLMATQSTLNKYMTRPDEPWGIVMAYMAKTLMGGKLFRRCRESWAEGSTISYQVQFDRSTTGRWVGPNSKLALAGVKTPVTGSVPRRYYQSGTYLDYKVLDQNKGIKEVLFDVFRHFKRETAADTLLAFESAIMAPDGNYMHDGGADGEFLIPFGWRYWFTIDGLHITGDTTRAVGGINPSTYPGWRHPYINPVTASDGLGAITSVFELRTALERMMRELRFDSPQTWGELAGPISKKDSPSFDPDGKGKPEDMGLYTDKRTRIFFSQVLFDREDQVTRDQARGRSVWKGIDIEDDDAMGLGDNGYGLHPTTAAALWIDRTGTYANGQWKKGGEMLVCRHKNFHVMTHPKHSPMTKRPYEPEGMFGIGHEFDFWLQTVVNDRRAAGGLISGYSFPAAA